MRLKHWAYMGLVLTISHESLLGGVRAAELLPAVGGRPMAGIPAMRDRFQAFWGKPAGRKSAPVIVRLFADEKLTSLWLQTDTPLSLSGRKVSGKFFLTVRGNKIHVFKGAHSILNDKTISIQSINDRSFRLKSRGGSLKWFRGSLKLTLVSGRLQVVSKVDLEDYVTGVLEGELGSVRLNPEVMRAQVVVARSYVLSMRNGRHNGQGYEFCDQPHCQVFRGVEREQEEPALFRSLRDTRGEIISYQGRVIPAFYHHNCGGSTSAIQDVWPAPARPYLSPVVEPAQGVCRSGAKAAWKTRLSKKRVTQCLRDAGLLKRKTTLNDLKIAEIDPSGRAKRITIVSQDGKTDITIGRFRNLINQEYNVEVLRSALFVIASDGDSFVVSGRGWGHGIGFCQEGAKWLSQHGMTYEQILQHYFPHTTLRQIATKN